jgi:ATP phosphoribosyltransferase
MSTFKCTYFALTPHRTNSVFLPASDIPSFVGKGNVDLGITGHDVILEAQMEEHVTEALRLGFGKCSLQVQVPDAAPVHDVEALAGKRIVTSFEVLAGRFFADIDGRAGLAGDASTQIEYVGGSVEAACALGLADAIGAYTYPRKVYHSTHFARSRPCRCVKPPPLTRRHD